MNFEIEVAGHSRALSVEDVDGASGQFRVVIDGASRLVSVRRTDVGLSVIFPDGRVLDAALTEAARGEWLVQLPEVSVTAIVDARRHSHGAPGGIAVAGAQRVTAPMPGRVLRVLVKVGDEVADRQGLVVVEAMKMENEIASPKAGRVKEIAASEGQSIEMGRLLVVIE
jgi:biotin carboxyl carrier protein